MRTLNVGFRTESFAPFSHLFARIAREKYDFDLRPVPKLGSGEEAELSILGGELDFVLGNHYTPLAAKARGINLCWLAVPCTEHDYKLATRPDLQDPEQLKGKKLLLTGGRCPELNEMLVLRQMGLEGKVEYATRPQTGRERTESSSLVAVRDGAVDATFVDSPMEIVAQRMGMKVFDAPSVEVVAGPCITTTTGFARKDPAMARDLLRAYLETIHAFKTDKDEVLELLFGQRLPFDPADQELAEAWYQARAARTFARPIPSPTALEWTQAKAAIDYPEAKEVNPLRLLELEPLLEVDEEGFIDRLWAGG